MDHGNIVLLNGTSSAGKTTIALALQDVLEPPYLHTGIDQFLIERLPRRLIVYSDGVHPVDAEGWLAIFRDDMLMEVRIGPLGIKWIEGMYRAVATLAELGQNVILDDVIYDPRVLNAALQILPPEKVFFIGIRCPLHIAEQREAQRQRAKGGARFFHDLVHTHELYDFEVDSAVHSASECAHLIQNYVASEPIPKAFTILRQQRTIR